MSDDGLERRSPFMRIAIEVFKEQYRDAYSNPAIESWPVKFYFFEGLQLALAVDQAGAWHRIYTKDAGKWVAHDGRYKL